MTGGFLSEAPKDERGEGLMSDTGTFLVWPRPRPLVCASRPGLFAKTIQCAASSDVNALVRNSWRGEALVI